MKQHIQAYQQDPHPHHSISFLKKLRKEIKQKLKTQPERKLSVERINSAIRYKQALYFQFCQYIIGFRWGMDLKRAKLR